MTKQLPPNIKHKSNKGQSKNNSALWILGIVIASTAFFIFQSAGKNESDAQVKHVKYGEKVVNDTFKIIERYNRKPNQYTQCLAFYNSTHLIETSGLYNISSVHFLRYDNENDYISPPFGGFNFSTNFNNKVFAEGCTLLNDKIYTLTYKEKSLLVFDNKLQNVVGNLTYPSFINEGWGLTHYNGSLIVSDGTFNLFFFDPTNLMLQRVLKVQGCSSKYGCSYLNELEIYKGYILANTYFGNSIYVINIATGKVEKEYNMTYLSNEVITTMNDPTFLQKGFVFNGIAYDEPTDTLLVTGKFWPFIYKIGLLNFPGENKSDTPQNSTPQSQS